MVNKYLTYRSIQYSHFRELFDGAEKEKSIARHISASCRQKFFANISLRIDTSSIEPAQQLLQPAVLIFQRFEPETSSLMPYFQQHLAGDGAAALFPPRAAYAERPKEFRTGIRRTEFSW